MAEARQDDGQRRIEVERAADGRFVVQSLGGRMPVGIRMTREEAASVVACLFALLEDPREGPSGALP